MPLFSEMPLKCCICGVDYKASVNSIWHRFSSGVCGEQCYDEKKWRQTLSTLGKDYYPNPHHVILMGEK